MQCRTCGVQHLQGLRHRCGEMHNRHQDCSQGDCFQGNACQYEGKQCATRGCNLTRNERRESQETMETMETMETRWHAWFKNQAREEAAF
ncbi:MAG: hypothetical protein WBM35_02445 [Candidatus Electrothrix sp.]